MIQDVALWLSKVGDEKEMEWFRQRFPHVRPEKWLRARQMRMLIKLNGFLRCVFFGFDATDLS
jgi:hypothetical protein